MPALRGASVLSAHRHFHGQAFIPVGTEAGAVGTEKSLMGEMRRAIDHEIREQRKRDRFTSTLVIAAAIIAAVRLAHDDISRLSGRLNSVANESVSLARSILDRIVP